MKKLFIIPITALLLYSCAGEDKQQKVCDCKKLYDAVDADAQKMEAEGMDGISSKTKAREAKKSEYEACEKFHTEVGDEQFYEMSQKCK